MRLTIPVSGDPLTFRPVTSSIVRKSKDGDVNVVILFFGTHYNITMDGILQQTYNGDIDTSNYSIGSNNGLLEIKLAKDSGGAVTPELIGTYSSFMYFYPGLKIRGHLKLSETSHSVPVPELEGHYHFTDLLSGDELFFRLVLDQNNLKFECVETVDAVENILYTEALGALVDEVFFEFAFLDNGKSKLYTFTDFATSNQVKTRKWIGDVSAKIGECNVQVHGHNDDTILKTISSDFIFLHYPKVTLKFDRTLEQSFVGQVKMYDDMNSVDEADWKQIRSRDYKFIGNRVVENGMIRVIIKTDNPEMEIYGWNYEAAIPSWEKALSVLTESDSGAQSLRIQNIQIEYFTKAQIKFVINFGTSVYSFLMTRGDPYLTFLNTDKTKFKFKSAKNRMGADFNDRINGYDLGNTFASGSPIMQKAYGTVTCASVLAGDTVTVNGLVYTAVSGVKADNTKFSIDTDDASCAADLADSINNDLRVGTDEATIRLLGVAALGVVTISSRAGGVIGNNIGLSSSNGTRLAVSGANLANGADSGSVGTETLSGYTLDDNYFGVYNYNVSNEVVGWISNLMQPDTIDLEEINGEIYYTFNYGNKGNIYGVGILPSFPDNLVGGIPFPFIIGAQDKYIKWIANESLLAFREMESFKRR